MNVASLTGVSLLGPSMIVDVPVTFHANDVGEKCIYWFIVFREVKYGFHFCAGHVSNVYVQTDYECFHSICVKRKFNSVPLFNISVSSSPSNMSKFDFLVDMKIGNVSAHTEVRVSEIATLSPSWSCTSMTNSFWSALSHVSRLLECS